MSKRTVASLAAALVLTPLGIAAVGDLDRTFGGDGTVVTDVGGDDYPSDVAVQRDGKIVVVGVSILPTGSAFVMTRYTASGALDRTFGDGGISRPDFGGLGWGMAVATKRTGRSSRPVKGPFRREFRLRARPLQRRRVARRVLRR